MPPLLIHDGVAVIGSGGEKPIDGFIKPLAQMIANGARLSRKAGAPKEVTLH